jgi:hypothetical protein
MYADEVVADFQVVAERNDKAKFNAKFALIVRVPGRDKKGNPRTGKIGTKLPLVSDLYPAGLFPNTRERYIECLFEMGDEGMNVSFPSEKTDTSVFGFSSEFMPAIEVGKEYCKVLGWDWPERFRADYAAKQAEAKAKAEAEAKAKLNAASNSNSNAKPQPQPAKAKS